MKRIFLSLFFVVVMTVCCSLSFSQEKSEPQIRVSEQERDNQKATFDHNQGIYESKANKAIRAKKKAVKKIKREKKQEKKVKEEQDKDKGQVQIKF